MNKKLAALLVVVGSFGAFTFFMPDDGVKKADLLDAGIADECGRVQVRCEVLLKDGGYGTGEAVVARCPVDGGTNIVLPPNLGERVKAIRRCRRIADSNADLDDDVTAVQDECACRRATGTCNKGNGTALEFGRVAGPDYRAPYNSFSGAGCRRMPCGVFAGNEQWPANCPREDAGVRIR